MFISVKHIDSTGLRVERTARLQPLTAADGRSLPFEPVEVSGVVTAQRGGFRFRGTLSTAGSVECARCLEPFRLPVRADFDLFYAGSAPEPVPGEDPEAQEQAQAFSPLVDEQIDLAALASEQIYLNLPLKPLCGPECRGLCPTCGANRNLTQCRCEAPQGEAGLEASLVSRAPRGRR